MSSKQQLARVNDAYNSFLKEIEPLVSNYGDNEIHQYLSMFRGRIATQIAALLDLIETNRLSGGRMLSLGGWPGITMIILKRLTGIQGTLIDHPALLTSSIQALCIKEGLQTAAFDFADANQTPLPVDAPVELIECCQCIEHWNFSPVPLFRQIFSSLLAPRGQFFVTVPNAVSLYRRLSAMAGNSPYPPMQSFISVDQQKPGAEVSPHWREYTQQDLKDLVEYCGGTCINLSSVTYPSSRHASWIHRLYIKCSTLHPQLRENVVGIFSKA